MLITALLIPLVAAFSIPGSSGEPSVHPLFQQIEIPGRASVRCEFPHRLAACKVRLSEQGEKTLDSLLDFGRGKETALTRLSNDGGNLHVNATYAGSGLEQGHCGLELAVDWGRGVGDLVFLVECLGQAEDGSWEGSHGILTADRDRVMSVIVDTPRLVLAAQHSDVAVSLKTPAGEALVECLIDSPSEGWVSVTGGGHAVGSGRYRLEGVRLDRGECGFTLPNVTQRDAGVWWWAGKLASAEALQAVVVLVKAAPVGEPQLTVLAPSRLRVGGQLKATCRAPPGVPPAKLVWLLGDREVRQDGANETQVAHVGADRPWEARAVVQTLTRTLTEDDVGRRLECRMEHEALDRARSVSHRLALGEGGGGPDCGVRGVPKVPLIAGGEDAAVGEFPWHVAIYRSEGKEKDKQICGGTLVSKTFVISAAHCFWDESQEKLKSASLFKVAAGKRMRSLRTREPGMQESVVAEIRVPQHYQGRHSNLAQDIAVVRLARGVEWSASVAPVCVDWDERRDVDAQLPPGVEGTVAGWGLTRAGAASEVLQRAALPVVAFDACFGALPRDLRRFYTDDKFCAGFVNKSRSVCAGDSGGGLVFPNADHRYYLRGVVSVAFKPPGNTDPCYSEMYTGFTLVSRYLNWAKKLVNP